MAFKRPAASSTHSAKGPAYKRPATAAATTGAGAAAMKRPAATSSSTMLKKPAAAGSKRTTPFAYNAGNFEEEKAILIKKGARIAKLREAERMGIKLERGDDDVDDLYSEVKNHSSAQAKQDREIAIALLAVHGELLQHFSEDLRNDEEVVLASLGGEVCGLLFASEALHNNRPFLLRAAAKCGDSLSAMRPKFRSDREIVCAAVQSDGSSLEFASENLQADREVVLLAMGNQPLALQHASPKFREDKELLLRAMKQCRDVWEIVSDTLRADKDFMVLAARECPNERDDPDDEEDDTKFTDIFEEAADDLQEELSVEEFSGACMSALAVAGQQAPVLSATLTRDGMGSSKAFKCEATLLSGKSFSVSVPDLGPGPTVNDLAKQLLAELRQQTKDDSHTHIFINFAKNQSDSFPVTVWDWGKPLADFL